MTPAETEDAGTKGLEGREREPGAAASEDPREASESASGEPVEAGEEASPESDPDSDPESDPEARAELLRRVRLIRQGLYLVVLPLLIPPLFGAEQGRDWLPWTYLGVLLPVAVALASKPRREALLGAQPPAWLATVDRLLLTGLFTLFLLEPTLLVLSAVTGNPLIAPGGLSAERRSKAFRLKPGATLFGHTINSEGFHDTEWSPEPAPGVRRIVALGDSFSVGIVPYDKNYLTLLEGSYGGRQVEILNHGIAATGPEEYLWLWRNEARARKPDAVILPIYLGNDLLIEKSGPSRLERAGWATFSTVARIVRIAQRAGARGGGLVPTEIEDGLAGFEPEAWLEFNIRRLIIFQDPLRDSVEQRFARAVGFLDTLLTEIPVPVLLVIIPDELQVNAALRESVLAEAKRQGLPTRHDFDRLGERMTALAARHAHVTAVDLLPALRAAEPDGATYRPRNTHWNARGNRVAATAIRPALGKLVAELGE